MDKTQSMADTLFIQAGWNLAAMLMSGGSGRAFWGQEDRRFSTALGLEGAWKAPVLGGGWDGCGVVSEWRFR
jgi:hypothetical protein